MRKALSCLLVSLLALSYFAAPTFARRAISITGNCSADTTNGGSYVSPSITPAVDDLILIIVGATDSVGTPSATDPFGSGTYTLSRTQNKASSQDSLWLLVRDALVVGSSTNTVAVTITGDDATGGSVCVFVVTGMSKVGLDAIQQASGQSNQSGGTTPAPVFGASVNTNNPTLGAVFNATNPAGMTPPTNWNELVADVGHANPPTGLEAVYRVSGFSGTTITWGSTSASAFGSISAELDFDVVAAGGGTAIFHPLLGVGKRW